MYRAHNSALSFKRKLLGSQIPTWSSILAYTSNQFRSSWKSSPNHTPKLQTGLSLQRKCPGRVSLLVQVPSRKTLLLSKLTFAPAIRSYSATAFFIVSISRWLDTNTVISSTNTETLYVRGPAKGIPRRAGFAPSGAPKQRHREDKTGGKSAGPTTWSWTPLNAFRLHAPLPEGCDTSC